MAGVKRRTKYRKNVAQELEDVVELEEGDIVCRVLGSRGRNLFDVESQDGVTSLCRLPTRFRKMVWIKRGSYVVCAQAEDDIEVSNKKGKAKVLFSATAILMEHQVKDLKKQGKWPERFLTPEERQKTAESSKVKTEEEEAGEPEKEVVPADEAQGGQKQDAPQITKLNAEEMKERMLQRYMYEEESSEEDDMLLPQNRNRNFADSSEDESSSEEESD